jgi:hypothetical protein
MEEKRRKKVSIIITLAYGRKRREEHLAYKPHCSPWRYRHHNHGSAAPAMEVAACITNCSSKIA